MGIWRIGPRFGLALVLLAAVCVAATRKAEPGQKRRAHPGRPNKGAAKWSACEAHSIRAGDRPQPGLVDLLD